MNDIQSGESPSNGSQSNWGRVDRDQPKQEPAWERNGSERALVRSGRRARRLGWFSIGLGTAQLLAPRRVAKVIGVAHDARACATLRVVGARELLAGIGILARRRPTGWLWSRVLGDAMDLALLARAFGSAKKKHRRRIPLAMAAVAGVTLLDIATSRQLRRGDKAASSATGSRTALPLTAVITINRTPEEVYAFWRNLHNLPRFMGHVESVEILDERRSHWEVAGPGGKTVEWNATISDDRPNEVIAWRTLEGADLANAGEVRFVRAPGGRGTEVRVRMRVEPPGGRLGRTIGKLLRKLPEIEVGNDLRRLKQLLEIGEVVQSDASIHRGPHAARPSSGSERESARPRTPDRKTA
jgi:uncharacterized membrane protein